VAHTGWERVRDIVRVRVLEIGLGLGFRVSITIRAAKYGHIYTHFDDQQTQSVDMRVINILVAVLVRLPPISVSGGWEWSVVTSVKPRKLLCTT